MIDLRVNGKQLQRTIQRAKERRIIIPTFAEQIHPDTIPDKIRNRLKRVGLWEVDPLNLFRITWKNEPKPEGGLILLQHLLGSLLSCLINGCGYNKYYRVLENITSPNLKKRQTRYT